MMNALCECVTTYITDRCRKHALKYVFNVYKLYIFNPYCWYSACFCIETGEVLCHTPKNYLHSVQHFHDIICQKNTI